MTKFVGKFRKNKNYNDDYNYEHKRHRDEQSEIKKLLDQKHQKDYIKYQETVHEREIEFQNILQQLYQNFHSKLCYNKLYAHG